MIGKLNHVAIAVPDLDKAVAVYRDALGANVSAATDEPDHGVTVVFVELENTKIELLHPLGDNSPIQPFLDKNPSGGMPPDGFLSRKGCMGELSPSGCKSSILVFSSSTKTTVTPWSGSSVAADTLAPSASR